MCIAPPLASMPYVFSSFRGQLFIQKVLMGTLSNFGRLSPSCFHETRIVLLIASQVSEKNCAGYIDFSFMSFWKEFLESLLFKELFFLRTYLSPLNFCLEEFMMCLNMLSNFLQTDALMCVLDSEDSLGCFPFIPFVFVVYLIFWWSSNYWYFSLHLNCMCNICFTILTR